MARERSFTAHIKIAGINPYVDVPLPVVESFGGGAKLAVLVKVAAAGAAKKQSAGSPGSKRLATDAARLKAIGRLAAGDWFRSTVLARRSSAPRLYLDTWMRETAGVGVGDRVRVTLRADGGSRDLAMPAALRDAFNANERAKAAWGRLAPSGRREILAYLNFLKTPAALERNVQKTIAGLMAKGDRQG